MLLKISLSIFIFMMVQSAMADLEPICKKPASNDIDVLTCCNAPEMLDEFEIIEKCGKLYLKEQEAVDTKSNGVVFDLLSPAIQCFAECILNETGSLKDNALQVDVAKKMLLKGLNDDKEWTPIVLNAVAECEEIAKKISSNAITKVNTGVCTDFSTLYFGCLDTELFKNCPASKWNSSEQCMELKSNAEKCPILYALL